MIPESAGRACAVQHILRWVHDVEYQFKSHRPDSPQSVYNPWMPFQPADFVAMMTDVVAEANGKRFLDVGGGPGTKPALAHELFGLDVAEIEVDRAMAQAASVCGQVFNQDALDFQGYGNYDIIWLYRPFKDAHFEYQLEQFIMQEMKPGAILAGGAWEMEGPPPWIPVIDDWDNGKRGAWMKPAI